MANDGWRDYKKILMEKECWNKREKWSRFERMKGMGKMSLWRTFVHKIITPYLLRDA